MDADRYTKEAEAPEVAKQASLWTRNFVTIALINFTTFLGFNMTTTGMPVYVASLGASDMVVGLVTTIVTTAALIVRPFSGLLLDRFSRKGVLVVGLASMAAVIIAYAVFPIVGVILFLRLLHGVGWGMASTATSTIAADTIPHKRFAEGMGYFALTSAIAVAFAPALAIALVQNSGATLMIAIAAGSTLVALILAISKQAKRDESAERKPLRLSNLFDRRALLPASVMLLINMAFAGIVTFIALHGQDQGVDNIFLYFIVYAVATIISRPVIGKIIDRTGFFAPGIFSTLCVAGTLVLVAFSSDIVMFCIAGLFAGLGFGAGMGTLQAMAVSSVPSQRRGVATSTFMFGFDAGIAIGATIAGLVAGAFGYSTMYLATIIFPLTACLVFLLMGRKRIARYSKSEL